MLTTVLLDFNATDALQHLDHMNAEELDALPFGVVAMAKDGVVVAYNQLESAYAGLSPERVIGRNFFTEVAPCTNNFLVADRMRSALELDECVSYVFSVRLRPTEVTLRLLRSEACERMFMVVSWDGPQ